MVILAIACAVLGAACSAIGVRLQYTAVRRETEQQALRLSGIARLVRNRTWRLGVLVLAVCAILQVLALTLAPVSVVSPIVVLALPLVALLHAHSTGERLGPLASWAIAVSTAGVAVFVVLTAGVARTEAVAGGEVLDAVKLVGLAVTALGIAGLVSSGLPRCVLMAVGAGAAYGLVSVLVRDVTYTLHSTDFARFQLVSALCLAVTFLVGSWFIQLAYASGPPDVVVACQAVFNPMVAAGIGMGMLGELDGAEGARVGALIPSGVLAIAGVVLLARYHPEAVRRSTQRLQIGHPNTREAQAGRPES